MSIRGFFEKQAISPWNPDVWDPDRWAPTVGWHDPVKNPGGWKRPASVKKRHELYLFHKYNQSPGPDTMQPLLGSVRGLVYHYGVKPYANRVPIHKEVLRSQATDLAIKSIRSYDPSKAQLNTHLASRLKGMDRFVKQRQNFSRVTEHRLRMLGDLNRAKDRLTDRLGREPTALEVADEAKIPVEQVELLLAELKEDRLESGAMENPFVTETPKERMILRQIRYELTPDEEKVFDYLTGQGGKPLVPSTGDIARRLRWSDSKVSQVKKRIQNKIAVYL